MKQQANAMLSIQRVRRLRVFATLLTMLLTLSVCFATASAETTTVSNFAALKDAINTADDGDVIEISGTIKITEMLTIPDGMSITITGDTLTRDTYTGTLFNVPAGTELTLDGGLTIDGGNNYGFNKELYEADLYAMNPVPKEDSAKYFTLDPNDPVASAYMMSVVGTLNLNDVTIENNYSTGSGIVTATTSGATVNLKGAQISHCANTQGSGLVVNASGAGIAVNMYEGTMINGCHVGGNHGIFKIYDGTVFTMYGGTVENTTGWNSNGNVIGCWWGTVYIHGGTIRANSSVYGPNNGRNAAVYMHRGSHFTMTDGTICDNVGRGRGGLDCPEWEEGNENTVNISGGTIINNKSIGGSSTPDLLASSTTTVTGGTFTQDVSNACAEGYGVAFVNGKYIVEEANDITYDLAGGTIENAPDKYVPGYRYTLPNPTREGYVFVGWTGANGNTPQTNLTVYSPADVGNVSYTANWEPEVLVVLASYEVHHYQQNLDGTYTEVTKDAQTWLLDEVGVTVTAKAKTYLGYKLNRSKTVSSAVLEESYVNAKGERVKTTLSFYYDLRDFTLTFNTDGGSEIAPITLKYTAPVAAPAEPVRTGFKFVGWTDENGAPATIPATMPAKDMTFTAKWEEAPITIEKNIYQVKHFTENLDGTYTEVQTEYPLYGTVGAVVTAKVNSYTGFVLNTQKSTISATLMEATVDANGQPVVTTLELYYDRKDVKITVVLENEDDLVITGMYGEKVTEPVLPAKDGCAFSHWTDVNGARIAFPATMPAEDMTVYPVYAGSLPAFTAPTSAQLVTVYEGQQAVMEARATNNPSYQWYISYDSGRSWKAIDGATSPVYTSSVTKLSNNGYLYYCKATNGAGSAQSELFTLEVLPQVVLPETGDHSNIDMWLLLSLASMAGIALLTIRWKKLHS